ncbi:MAG: nucleotidyltransferase domain-containing protein [archaeon GB-1867-035]|nr:nucleotidyltransferase domain-containing protein [Candidatus Culexmicrobium profundum]
MHKNLEWLPQTYRKALKNFLKQIKPYLKEIKCLAIVGSAARREDFIDGWSDIDMLVITKNREIIDEIKRIAEKINETHSKTIRGIGIISLWIDVDIDVYKWLGTGCEYYNITKNFILLHGEDIRKLLAEPSRKEILKSIIIFTESLEKHLSKIKEEMLEKISSHEIASILFPLLRFYLCYKGHPTASKIEIINTIKNKQLLTMKEIQIIETIFQDILKGRSRIDPKLNREAKALIEKIISKLSNITLD